MLSEQVFLNRFKTITGYTVILGEGQITGDIGSLTSPRIEVGFLGMRPENPQIDHSDGYADYEHELILHVNLDIICARTSLSTVLDTIRNKYLNWYPEDVPNNKHYSSCFFVEANVRAVYPGYIHWNEIIGVKLPRLI